MCKLIPVNMTNYNFVTVLIEISDIYQFIQFIVRILFLYNKGAQNTFMGKHIMTQRIHSKRQCIIF